MLASLIFDVVLAIPAEQRRKPLVVLCTDTRVEIPANAEMIERTLDHMWKCSGQHDLNIDVNPPIVVSECVTRQLAVGGQKLWRRLMY